MPSALHGFSAHYIGRMLSRKEAAELLDKIKRHATSTRKWRGALGTLAATLPAQAPVGRSPEGGTSRIADAGIRT
jgi:hypothetical protein